MSNINPIAIDIELQTLPLPQQGFGMPLILGGAATGVAYQEVTQESDLVGILPADAEYKMAAKWFSQSPRPEKIAVYRRDTDLEVSITAGLDALKLANKNSWYALFIPSRIKTDLHEAGDWCGANGKLFIGGTTDKTALTGRNQIREAYLISNDAANFPEVAWSGSVMTYTPGSATWSFKKSNGVVESGFNTTDTNAILNPSTGDAPGNVFANMAGVVVSAYGKTTGLEFIETIVSRDYVQARMLEALSRLLIVNKKIPYTLAGFALVESEIRSVLRDAGLKGIIAEVSSDDDKTRSDLNDYQYQVVIPQSLDEIPTNDRANFKLPISFKFRIAGAVHYMDISGTITV